MRLGHAESLYRRRAGRGHRPAELALVLSQVVPMTDDVAKESVPVLVNHGRWIVECPTPGCGGAQATSPEDPRFLCTYCANIGTGGKWIRVVWPRDPEAIEELLVDRPANAQNWRPGESAELLRAENLEHGIGRT